MSNKDDETEELDVGKVHEYLSENQTTVKLTAVGDTQDTVNRAVPAELLKRSKPSTIQTNAIVDISTSLLEEVPVLTSGAAAFQSAFNSTDLDATREMLQVGIEEQTEATEIIFSGTIDASGRIQLPATYLTDPRIRPGRKMTIRIEFID